MPTFQPNLTSTGRHWRHVIEWSRQGWGWEGRLAWNWDLDRCKSIDVYAVHLAAKSGNTARSFDPCGFAEPIKLKCHVDEQSRAINSLAFVVVDMGRKSSPLHFQNYFVRWFQPRMPSLYYLNISPLADCKWNQDPLKALTLAFKPYSW